MASVELAAGGSVAEAHQLGDAGLAAKAAAVVDLDAAGRHQQQLGAVEDGVGLALDLGADEVGQRPAHGGAERQRQGHVQERDVGAVGGRQRDAHAGALAQQGAGPHRHLLQQHQVGRVADDQLAHLIQQLAMDVAVLAVGRDVAAVGDVPGADSDAYGIAHQGDATGPPPGTGSIQGMRIPGRARFGDVIARQLAMFADDHHDLMLRVEQARVSYTHAGASEAEERYGDYMDLVEEAEEELLALRDRYAETMAARDRMRYEREFSKAAERRLPSLVVRRIYQRAMDPDLDE